MFRDAFNTKTITIYTPHNGSYVRNVVRDCIIESDTDLIIKSQGLLPLNTIKIFIPTDNYVPIDNYKGSGWTINLGPSKESSLIVEGVCNYSFKKVDINIDTALREFEKSIKYRKPKIIKERIFNEISELNHLEVIC